MTPLVLADTATAADLGGYLTRLLRYDRRAIVRLRAEGGVLAVFGHPPFGEGSSGVLTLRACRLTEDVPADATVSAGRLLDGIGNDATLTVPEPVAGPPWAGMLPPRSGWKRIATIPVGELAEAVAAAVAEFRRHTGSGAPRAELDRVAAEVWNRPTAGALPLRAAHAAQAFGFLGPGAVSASGSPGAEAGVLAVGGWLRLEAPYGSVSVRRSGAPGLLFAR